MAWFVDLSTRSKLLLGFGSMLMLLAVAMGTAYWGISSIKGSQRNLYQHQFRNAVDVLTLRSDSNGIHAALMSMMAVTTNAERDNWHQNIKQRSKEIDAVLERLKQRNSSETALIARLERLDALRTASAETRENQTIPLIYAGEDERARTLALGIQQARFMEMRTIAQELGDQAVERAQAALLQSEHLTDQTLRAFIGICIAALVLGLAMALLLHRIIATPLRSLSRVSRDISRGNLDVSMPPDARADEVGDLLRSFQEMVTKLRETTRELNGGVNVLATSASEILATTAQVASGASQTAAAVSETTATVAEVKQAAQMASQKARHLSGSAQKVAQISDIGRKSAEDVIAGMHRIEEQMGFIAESIVRLSEQSQSIAEIMATVNDLAEQSNVLAVNAAIEATKAGEQGKGFVVVAQEVKSLAQQSKQATAQVRAILNDIQRATSAAVLATEQGHKAVEAGAKQSSEANDCIRQLAENIQEAVQAATQIAASSQQQMVGMDQVAQAMDNIKQASTQNVAGTRQAESAARNLHELGLKLKQLAEQYQV